MRNNSKKKKGLSIERFEVARFRNTHYILGGNDTNGDETATAVTSKHCKEKK